MTGRHPAPAVVAIGGGHGLAATLRAVRTYTDRITGREVTVSGGAFDLAQAPAVIG